MTAMAKSAPIGARTSQTGAGRQASFVRRLLSSPGGWIGTVVTLAVVLVAVLAPLIATQNPITPNLVKGGVLQPPSLAHLLGSDELGRDILSRVLYGARVSLLVAAASIGLAVFVGTALGTSSAMYGRWLDFVVMRLTDALLAFPLLVLAIAISVALGRGPFGLTLAIASVNIPIFTRLTRAQAMQIKELQFMTAATAMGASNLYKITRHVFPNLVNELIVQASNSISFAIIIEAGLSFLGLGIQPPAPSWGSMIAASEPYMTLTPHLMLAPAGALVITVLGLNLLGDALSDALDPRMDER